MKKIYISPVVNFNELNVENNIMILSDENHAGGVSTKDREDLEDEEAAAAAQQQNYSLW